MASQDRNHGHIFHSPCRCACGVIMPISHQPRSADGILGNYHISVADMINYHSAIKYCNNYKGQAGHTSSPYVYMPNS